MIDSNLIISEDGKTLCGIKDPKVSTIRIPNTITCIGKRAFNSCAHSLISVDIPNSVTSIEDYAFICCYLLQKITIPNSVRKIGCYAFSQCNSLQTINIPRSVTTIVFNPFECCSSLSSITVDSHNCNYESADGILFEKGKKTIVAVPSGKNIHSYRIPNSVTKIGDDAFRGCKNLLSIDIPRSVTSISNGAFGNCTSLLSVDIPDTVSSIEGGTFSTCRSLQRISIPNSVTSIGRNPFLFCDFNTITIPDSVKSIGDYAFLHCESLKAIHIKVKNPYNIKIGKDIFSCEAEESCVLFVPSDSLKEYCNHPIFSKFKNIVTE